MTEPTPPQPKKKPRARHTKGSGGRVVGQGSRARPRKPPVEEVEAPPVELRFTEKISPEVVARVEQALASGMPPADAAPFAGIARSTFHNWMKWGRLADADPRYVEFVEMVEQAISGWATGVAASLTAAAREGDTRAAMFMLERRLPQAFGRTDRLELGNVDGEPFRVLAANFDLSLLDGASDEELAVLRSFFARQAESDNNVIDIDSRRQLGAG